MDELFIKRVSDAVCSYTSTHTHTCTWTVEHVLYALWIKIDKIKGKTERSLMRMNDRKKLLTHTKHFLCHISPLLFTMSSFGSKFSLHRAQVMSAFWPAVLQERRVEKIRECRQEWKHAKIIKTKRGSIIVRKKGVWSFTGSDRFSTSLKIT